MAFMVRASRPISSSVAAPGLAGRGPCADVGSLGPHRLDRPEGPAHDEPVIARRPARERETEAQEPGHRLLGRHRPGPGWPGVDRRPDRSRAGTQGDDPETVVLLVGHRERAVRTRRSPSGGCRSRSARPPPGWRWPPRTSPSGRTTWTKVSSSPWTGSRSAACPSTSCRRRRRPAARRIVEVLDQRVAQDGEDDKAPTKKRHGQRQARDDRAAPPRMLADPRPPAMRRSPTRRRGRGGTRARRMVWIAWRSKGMSTFFRR